MAGKKQTRLTLNRSGVCEANMISDNQCKAVGHKKYEYEARIVFKPKLDEQGFVIDHTAIHAVVESVFGGGMMSCEQITLKIAKKIEKACREHGCSIISIYVKVRPVPASKKDKVMAFMETEVTF